MGKRTRSMPKPNKQMKRFAQFWIDALHRRDVRWKPGSGRAPNTDPAIPLKTFAREHGVCYQTWVEVVKGLLVPRDSTILREFCTLVGFTSEDQQFLALLEAHRARMPQPFARRLDPFIAQVAGKL